MTEVSRPGASEHLNDLELATLAELSRQVGAGFALPPHVLDCEHCFAIFAEFERSLSVHAGGLECEELPSQLLALARAIPSHHEQPARRRRPDTIRRLAVPALLSAAALVLAWNLAPKLPDPDEALRARREGPAYPGLEHLVAAAPGPEMRSADAQQTRDLEQRLDAALEVDRRDASLGSCVEVASLQLALNRPDYAAIQIQEGLRRHPDAAQLILLQALWEFDTGFQESAVERLVTLLQRDPDDQLVRYNLALMLYARGEPGGHTHLTRISQAEHHSPLALSSLRILADK